MSIGLDWIDASASYGGRLVLEGVTLAARPGRILGIVGANGAGKTTLFRLACGLMSPRSGTVLVNGNSVTTSSAPQGMGALIEEPRFYPWASGRRNLEAMCAGRADRLARVPDLIAEVGLSTAQGDQPVREYSQGMRQRLGIARALLGDPSVLVLDEPANGLDPVGLRWLAALLDRLRDNGRAVIVSSHVLSHLERGADDVAILADGRLLRAGPLAEVIGPGESLEDVYFRLAAPVDGQPLS